MQRLVQQHFLTRTDIETCICPYKSRNPKEKALWAGQ